MTRCHNQSKGLGRVLFFPVYIPDSSPIQLPFRRDSFSSSPTNSTDVARHNRRVALVEQVLAGTINATDRQIDRLVYELYGLTEDEVRIVEGVV